VLLDQTTAKIKKQGKKAGPVSFNSLFAHMPGPVRVSAPPLFSPLRGPGPAPISLLAYLT